MPLPAGTQLGDCEILEPLGAGGMGEVYKARDQSLGREVAVKVLPEELASNPDRLRRFEQEARAAAALNHPNILAIYRFGTTETHAPYLVTELLLGQNAAGAAAADGKSIFAAVGKGEADIVLLSNLIP